MFLSRNGIKYRGNISVLIDNMNSCSLLSNKLGFEHDVICSDIQCESNGKFGSKNRLFWSWLSLCVKEV